MACVGTVTAPSQAPKRSTAYPGGTGGARSSGSGARGSGKRNGKPRRGGTHSLADVLNQTRGSNPHVPNGTPPIPPRDWDLAVGSRIAMRAVPEALERGVLWVRTNSAAWAQELNLLAVPILAKLHACGHVIRELRFRVSPIRDKARAPEIFDHRTRPAPLPLPDELAADIAHVEDAELRDLIATTAAQNLGWQAHEERESKRRVAAERFRAGPHAPGNAQHQTGNSAPASRKR